MKDSNKTIEEIISQVSKNTESIEPSVVDALKNVFSDESIGDLKKSEINELAKELTDLQAGISKKEDEEQN